MQDVVKDRTSTNRTKQHQKNLKTDKNKKNIGMDNSDTKPNGTPGAYNNEPTEVKGLFNSQESDGGYGNSSGDESDPETSNVVNTKGDDEDGSDGESFFNEDKKGDGSSDDDKPPSIGYKRPKYNIPASKAPKMGSKPMNKTKNRKVEGHVGHGGESSSNKTIRKKSSRNGGNVEVDKTKSRDVPITKRSNVKSKSRQKSNANSRHNPPNKPVKRRRRSQLSGGKSYIGMKTTTSTVDACEVKFKDITVKSIGKVAKAPVNRYGNLSSSYIVMLEVNGLESEIPGYRSKECIYIPRVGSKMHLQMLMDNNELMDTACLDSLHTFFCVVMDIYQKTITSEEVWDQILEAIPDNSISSQYTKKDLAGMVEEYKQNPQQHKAKKRKKNSSPKKNRKRPDKINHNKGYNKANKKRIEHLSDSDGEVEGNGNYFNGESDVEGDDIYDTVFREKRSFPKWAELYSKTYDIPTLKKKMSLHKFITLLNKLNKK